MITRVFHCRIVTLTLALGSIVLAHGTAIRPAVSQSKAVRSSPGVEKKETRPPTRRAAGTPRRKGRGRNSQGRPFKRGADDPRVVHDPTGFKPLTEMGKSKYKGLAGGLYGGGKNDPPKQHQTLARNALTKIQPLDKKGRPSRNGKVVLISIGMSNTTMEFRIFKQIADADPRKASHVVIVDTAQGGRSAKSWAKSLSGNSKRSKIPLKSKPYKGTPGENRHNQEQLRAKHTVWDEADRRVRIEGLSPLQVQVAWVKVAGSVKLSYPEHLKEYQSNLATIAKLAKQRYPNLQIVYFSSRIYAGYAATMLNPEPWSYESVFGVRGVIQQQIDGDPTLNADPNRGVVNAPVLLWGPYMWADGMKPRADGLVWERKDLATDGIHPTRSGTRKVANMLLRFMTTSPQARPWFVAKPAARSRQSNEKQTP